MIREPSGPSATPSPRRLDEMEIHLVAKLLGRGVRLFEDLTSEAFDLRRIRCIETPGATHLRFEVVR